MPEREIGFAVLGCGGIAWQYHLPALRRNSGVRVVAVADPAPSARARVEGLGADIACEPDAAAVLARRDVDAVVVCAENAQHAALAHAALEEGKHVYLEKPLALTVEDGRSLVDAAQRAPVVSAVGFNLRFHPVHQEARGILARDEIGPIVSARAVFHEPSRRRRMPAWKRRRATGGGALLDLGSHTVDLLRWHLSDEVAEVAGTVRSRRFEHDAGRMRLRMSSGVRADIACRLGSTRADVLELKGERGTLHVDRYGGTVSVGRRPARSLNPPLRRLSRRATRPPAEQTFAAALDAFVRRIEGGRDEVATFEDGLRSLETVLAAERGR